LPDLRRRALSRDGGAASGHAAHDRHATHYAKTADSGRQRVQAFCGTCGSHLYACDPGEAKERLSLRIGAIAERHQLAPPVRQIWCDSALDWAFDLDAIPKTAQQ
jgi:hypothetical protein